MGWLEASDAVGLLTAFAAARWLTAPGGNPLALSMSLEGVAHALGVMVCWQLAFAALRVHEPRRALLQRGELARAAGNGLLGLREALEALLHAWPETARLQVQAAGDMGEVCQLCPPARLLLLHIAEAIAGAGQGAGRRSG